GQGAAAVAWREGAVHLLSLGLAGRLGQPQRVRARGAEEERQQRLSPPGDRARPAAVRGSAWRTDRRPGERALSQRVDGRDGRVLHRLRRRAAARGQRVAWYATRRGERLSAAGGRAKAEPVTAARGKRRPA